MVHEDLGDPEETRAQKLVVQATTLQTFNPLDFKCLHQAIFVKSLGNCGRWRIAWNSRKLGERGLIVPLFHALF